MTIPVPPTPDVTPLFFQQQPTLSQAIQPSIQNLLAALDARAKAREAAEAKATERIAGETLRDAITRLDTDILPASLTVPVGGAGGTMPVPLPQTQIPGPLAQAFAGKPGEAVYAALGRGQPIVTQALAQRAERAQQSPVKDRNTQLLQTEDGTAMLVDRNTGMAQLVLDEQGRPVKYPRPGADKSPRPFHRYVKDGREYVAWVVPGSTDLMLQPLPPGFAPSGVTSEAVQKATARYLTSSTAFRQAKGDAGLSKDFAQYLLAQTKLHGQKAMTQWIAEAALDDDAKRQLLNWTTILKNTVYKYSGAAVTVAEFYREFQRIPIKGENPRLREQKLNLTRMDIYSDWLTGRNELGRSEALNPSVEIPGFQELWEEPGDATLTEDQRQRALNDPEYAQFLREKGLWP